VASIPCRIAAPSPLRERRVAVLGTGIDVMYPRENTRLTEQIVALGGRADHRVSGENSAKNLWGPKHSDQAGSEARRHLGRASDGDSGHAQSRQDESPEPATASLFPDEVASPHEKRSLSCSSPMTRRISINWSNCWKTKRRLPKSSLRAFRTGVEWQDTAVGGEEFCEEFLMRCEL
jgi:hypothetical protein